MGKCFQTAAYGDEGIADGIDCVGVFIVKKAIARSKIAIHISKNPNPTAIIKIAPMKRSTPAVPNKPTFVLSFTCVSDLLKKNVEMIAKTQTTTKTATNVMINPEMRGIRSDGLTLAVVGDKPERVDQSPFQSG